MNPEIFRLLVALAGGLFCSVVRPALPAAGLCTVMVLIDVFTAWTLSRRVRKKYGTVAAMADAGKLQSRRLGRVLVTLGKIYVFLFTASFADYVLCPGNPHLLQFSTGAVVFWQAVSILENESSCTSARWPSWVRKLLMDKAARHLRQ